MSMSWAFVAFSLLSPLAATCSNSDDVGDAAVVVSSSARTYLTMTSRDVNEAPAAAAAMPSSRRAPRPPTLSREILTDYDDLAAVSCELAEGSGAHEPFGLRGSLKNRIVARGCYPTI